MIIYISIIKHALIPNSRIMMIYKILQDMNKKILKKYYNPNITLFNCRIMIIYFLLFFMQDDYIKNIISILEFVLNSIVFNEYEQINQSYGLNIIMNFKMQLEQRLRKMHRD